MDLTKLLELMPNKKREQIQKVIDTLKMGGRSEKTIDNYVCSINRFLEYFQDKDISKLNENHIVEYIKNKYLKNNCAASTYNMNIYAIKYFYSVNFNRELNNKLLPHAKLTKRIPTTIDRSTFTKIFDEENNLKHKCWLLLAFCSGLRVEEIAGIRINDINAKEHRLKVLGKRKKERYTVLTDFTISYLRLYYKSYYLQEYNHRENVTGYLFEGYKFDHIQSKTITNYFIELKEKYNLDKNVTFHSLRHSFASNFIKAGGDSFTLKSMLGHSSMNTTSIYVHMGRDFNNLRGVNYEQI